MPTDVLFITQNLDRGGAQRQLVTLARGLARRGHSITVAVFYSRGTSWPELEWDGVRVVALEKGGRWDVAAFLARVGTLVRNERPRVIHGYLDVPNVLALLLRPVARGARIVWGVRSAYVDWDRFDRLTRFTFSVACRLSRFADLIILNSFAGHEHHRALGYRADRMVVVPNGIDTELFAPDAAARASVRAEWGVRETEILIGLVGRVDPLKGHDTFLHAAAAVMRRHPGVRWVCIGGGDPRLLAELQGLSERLGVAIALRWVGERHDMPAVYNALDVAVSPSISEGFSNVIGEALATGVTCVATDIGDSARIVGDATLVAPVNDVAALTRAIEAALGRLGPDSRASRRARVLEHFSVSRLISSTEEALRLPPVAGEGSLA